MRYAEKLSRFRDGHYEMPAPPVYSGKWKDCDWIEYIDQNGKWLEPKTRTERGFRVFADFESDKVTYGSSSRNMVTESSLAYCGPHCWIRQSHKQTEDKQAIQLSVKDAIRISNALLRFAKEAEDGELMEQV
tara:strand:+ start:786 stop:1181 length:396 start_codon:yes stop_codon:yes gene_type:complete